ncbi:MAG: hypothetical protein BGO98_44875 [Myxococcales bacterium 68-20]|nr:MAG: hypothetical protein BGO98_44875 [Myxococcales bacterium 68-20]
MLPHDLFPRNDEQLRVAARELRYTSLLKRTADGEYRFRYRFAEEILAALATSSVTPESLHSLVTGPDGKLRDDLTQYAATFAALNGPDRPVLVADGNRVSRFSRDEVRDWVDRLVAAAGRVTTWIKGQDMLRWLNVGGLEDDLASRVSNRTLASGGRQVLFDIAQVNRIAGSFADNALTIVLSNDEDIELRERAVYYLSDLGSLVHIQGLTALASAAPSSSSVLRARALRVLLERGLERPLRVASLAERPEPHHYDARAALVSAIEAALTHEEALLLVQSWTDEVRAAELPSIDEAILEELREAAVKLLASQRDAEAADVDALVSLFLDDERTANHRGVSAEIDDAFRNKKELRRVAFASLDDRPYRVDRFISQDDFSWLIEDGTTTGARKYVATIYRLRASGVLGPGATSEATAFLEARADVLAELDRDWAEAEASRQEWLRRHPPREPQTRRALRDVLRTVLESDMPPSNRLRALGAYCFATEGWARSDITGSFDELQDDERAAVIAAMVAALPAASPTPIPDAGSSFPVAILYEAAAVAALVLRRQDVRSDTATVERWLPTLLFDLREEIAAAVSYLIEDHGELAEVAAAGAIRRELRAQSEHVHIAYSLPPELWTARFVRVVSALVRDASYATASRRALLLCLPEHAHEEGARKEVLAAVEDCFSTDELRAAALECLAALDPRGSWPRLRAALRTERDLTILRPWFDRHRTPAIAIDDVADVPFMEDVIAHFFAVLGHEPEDLGPRVVTPADDARALRTRFLDRLISDPSPEAVAAVERLAVLDPTIGRWKEQFVANCDIRSVLEELEVRWLPSPRDVVRVLDESLFRFLRSEADLHRLAREILANHIGASVGNDIDMFWFRPTGGEESKAREAALQAYVRRRLEDLLPLYSPVARVELPREQQVQRRRRFDVLIITALPEQRLGSVVIEIKWSHDARVRKALRDQLVKSYLLGEGRSHGLYVVGMTGADRNSAKLLRDLQTRRDDCLREHPSLTIDVVALPCQWSDGGDNAAGGSEEGVPSGSGSRRGKKTATRTRAKAKAAMKVKAKPKAKTKMAPARKSTKKSKRTARRPTEPSRSPRGRQ